MFYSTLCSYKSAREHQKLAENGVEIGDTTDSEQLGKSKRRKTKKARWDPTLEVDEILQQSPDGIVIFKFFILHSNVEISG